MSFALQLVRFWYRVLDLVLPRVAARQAARLFLTPYPRKPASKFGSRRPLRRSTLTFEGEQLPVFRFGPEDADKRALLCHGWGGCGSQLSSFIDPLTERGFEVIAFDGPAHGSSRRRQTNVVEFSRFLQQLADEVGGVDVALGHSFGAAALTYAVYQGLPVSRIALVAPFSSTDVNLDQFAKVLQLSPRLRAGVERELRQLFAEHLKGWVLSDVAPELKQPALVIHDEEDKEVPVSQGISLGEAWPGADLHVTRGLGHKRILRNDDIVERVATFLSRS